MDDHPMTCKLPARWWIQIWLMVQQRQMLSHKYEWCWQTGAGPQGNPCQDDWDTQPHFGSRLLQTVSSLTQHAHSCLLHRLTWEPIAP